MKNKSFIRRNTYPGRGSCENKHSYTNGQMDTHIDRVTYIAGDEVTEFAVIPLNLRQVHFWYSIFEFRSVAGQMRSLGVDTKRSARDTERNINI